MEHRLGGVPRCQGSGDGGRKDRAQVFLQLAPSPNDCPVPGCLQARGQVLESACSSGLGVFMARLPASAAQFGVVVCAYESRSR
jgi:hypothetical protein